MTAAATVLPSRTVAVISSHYLVSLGLQNILGGAGTVMHVHPRMISDTLRTDPLPDLFILDLETDRDAIGTIRRLRESAQTSKILLLSGIEDRQRLYEAVSYGVDGVILTIQPPEVILAVIKNLYASAPCQEQVDDGRSRRGNLTTVPQQNVNSAAQPSVLDNDLTQREHEVIQLVQQGLSNKEIACKLFISDHTVRHHLTNIFEKVGVPNRKKLMIPTPHFRSPHV